MARVVESAKLVLGPDITAPSATTDRLTRARRRLHLAPLRLVPVSMSSPRCSAPVPGRLRRCRSRYLDNEPIGAVITPRSARILSISCAGPRRHPRCHSPHGHAGRRQTSDRESNVVEGIICQ
jgi:hypothetical protein